MQFACWAGTTISLVILEAVLVSVSGRQSARVTNSRLAAVNATCNPISGGSRAPRTLGIQKLNEYNTQILRHEC